MGLGLIVTATFWLLLLGRVRSSEGRAILRERTRDEWWLDGVGLAVQGALIPLMQVGVVFAAWHLMVPSAQGSLHVGALTAFALNFVVLDYAYYWNHRALHGGLWPLHRVHHTVRHFDVLSTSRNTAWSSLLIVYVWMNGSMAFWLADPAPFLLGAALTAALDLWRHSALSLPHASSWQKALGAIFVLPGHHAAHHAPEVPGGNFGANLSIWDRVHGTYLPPRRVDSELGLSDASTLTQKLWWPFG